MSEQYIFTTWINVCECYLIQTLDHSCLSLCINNFKRLNFDWLILCICKFEINPKKKNAIYNYCLFDRSCKVFLILQFPSIWYTCLKIYVIISKFIIKAEVCYLLKCYILAGVNDLMCIDQTQPTALLILYFPFPAAGRSWNTSKP